MSLASALATRLARLDRSIHPPDSVGNRVYLQAGYPRSATKSVRVDRYQPAEPTAGLADLPRVPPRAERQS